MVEIENLNYYRGKLEKDIKSIESNMNIKKKWEKIAMDLSNITEEQKDVMYNVYDAIRNTKKISLLENEISNKCFYQKQRLKRYYGRNLF